MKLFFTLLLLTVWSSIYADTKPTRLYTDLVEHTDRTYHDGYLCNLMAKQAGDFSATRQFATIKSSAPTFSWSITSDKQGTVQTGYRIIVCATFEQATTGQGSVWDSQNVNSRQSSSVQYGGKDLLPNTTYFWRVKTFTNTDDESEWSDVKAFRTAGDLKEYQTTYYPTQKTDESPTTVTLVDTDTYLCDFGRAAFGQLSVTLTSHSERDSVVVHLGERLDGQRVNRKPGGTIRYQAYTVRLIRGTHTYHIELRTDNRHKVAEAIKMPTYIGAVLPFRYCEVEGYKLPLVAGSVSRAAVHYQFDDTASDFRCSNDTLNQIWDLCKYTIKATSFAGLYVDGDRERIPYEADVLINQLSHYAVDREYSIARRTHEYLLTHPTWPTEWIMQSVLIAWNDYLYTGDSRSLTANYDILKSRTLHSLKAKNGLISTTTPQTPEFLKSINRREAIRDIVDWPHTGILGLNKSEAGETDGFVFRDYNTVVNAYHYHCMRQIAQIAVALGQEKDAAYFTLEADKLKELFNKLLFDPAQRCYVDGVGTTHASLHGNMFALAFGLVPAKHEKGVREFIRSRQMACSVYGAQFLMDALFDHGDADYAITLLTATNDRSWYNMIRSGSTITLEAWDDKYKPNQDWNHAWGAVPANIIMRKLMGVEPLTPAFERVRIRPQTGALKWARASVPTIRGDIEVQVDNKQSDDYYWLTVEIPANMEAEIHLPVDSRTKKVWLNGSEIAVKQVVKVSSGKYIFKVLD